MSYSEMLFTMAQIKQSALDHIQFENVSFQVEGFDTVLKSVDLDFPMDQTVVVQSSNPSHAVHLLQILAGRQAPQAGKVRWSEAGLRDLEDVGALHEVVGCYFESQRPSPDILVSDLLKSSMATESMIQEAVEYFSLRRHLNKKFRDLKFETQKLVLMLLPTLKTPQMLILEDPAVGVSEKVFLNYLDWIQLWQRQGHIRHVYMTNNHPVAARHLGATTLFVEDGLIYLDDENEFKKIVHF